MSLQLIVWSFLNHWQVILWKSPLKYAVVRNAKSLDPEIMYMIPEKGTKLFKSLVDNLVQLDWVALNKADGIYAKHKRYLEMVVIKNRQLFLKFNKREYRLHEFFFSDTGGLSDYLKLSKVIKMMLALFHGEGCVERGFNVNEDVLQPNLVGMSLISQRMIFDHYLVSNDLSPPSITITKELNN